MSTPPTEEIPLIARLALKFIDDPTGSSFEEVYKIIWDEMQPIIPLLSSKGIQDQSPMPIAKEPQAPEAPVSLKEPLQYVINQIFDATINLNTNGLSTFAALKMKLDFFIKKINILSRLFVYYNMNVKQSENVTILAVSSLLKYLFLEQTQIPIKQAFSDIWVAYRKGEIDCFPEEISPCASFIATVCPTLYLKLFEQTVIDDSSLFLETLSFTENQKDIFQDKELSLRLLNDIFEFYSRMNSELKKSLQQSTVDAFTQKFTTIVMSRYIDLLTDPQMINICCSDPDALHNIFTLVSLGDSSWLQMLSQSFMKFIRSQLDLIDIKSDFFSIGQQIANIHEKANELISKCFDNTNEISHGIKSTFFRYLEEHHFSYDLCQYFNREMQPAPFLTILAPYINIDLSGFEDTYNVFLARRLLHDPNLDAEHTLLNSLKEVGINLEKAGMMLNDISSAPQVDDFVNGAQIHLTIVNKFCWSMLQPMTLTPPAFFAEAFQKATSQLNCESERKQVSLTDHCSTVEFSDGNESFELPFIPACIIQTILENGPIHPTRIAELLNLSLSNLKPHFEFLLQSHIIEEDGELFVFVGPPTVSVSESGEKINEQAPEPEDPVMYTNCNQQIDAAIVRYLKQQRYAQIDQIKEEVRRILPPQFRVTDEKIEASLVRLKEKELIMQHGGRADSYRYWKQCR